MNRRSMMLGLISGALLSVGTGSAASLDMHMGARDVNALARTIYGEAIGEPERGQLAVAHVVFNRVRSHDPLFAHDVSVERACLRSGQFTCWKNNARLMNLTPDALIELRRVVGLAMLRYHAGDDLSRGATHYLPIGMHTVWSSQAHPTTRIGRHQFYKL